MNIRFICVCMCALVVAVVSSGCIISTGTGAKARAVDTKTPGSDRSARVGSGTAEQKIANTVALSVTKPSKDDAMGRGIEAALRSHIPAGDKAKLHAYQLATQIGNVKKIKVCWDKRFEEWRFTLYQDVGDYYDLKQFFWKIDQPRPEAFCVLKHMAKDRLSDATTVQQGENSCSVFDPEPSTIQSVLASVAPQENAQKSPEIKTPPTSVQPVVSPVKGEPKQTVSANDDRSDVVARRTARTAKETKSVLPKAKTGTTPGAVASRRDTASTSDTKASEREAPPLREPRNQAKPKPVVDQPAKQANVATPDSPSRTATHAEKVLEAPKPRVVQAGGGIIAVSDDGIPAKRSRLEPRFNQASAPPQPVPDRSRKVPTCLVFVYGSEMNHQELMQWIEENGFDSSSVLEASPALLDGYDYVWNFFSASRNAGTVNIEPHPDGRVYGLLLEVEDGVLKAFDARAGHPRSYSRGDKRLTVRRLGDGSSLHAWVYRAKPNRAGKHDVFPSPQYKRKIVEAALFWQFPKDYVEKLRDWPTQQ
jgi:gamma-glutamylcyclotransferase (GGCT)/AIG2-like uncharacterized protein YtfP